MGDAWIVLAVVVVLTMVALVGWSLRRRRPEAVDELAETPPPADLLDVPITESIPSSGLLVPIQSTESLTLGVMLREELERSKQAPPPFTLDYRTISAELIPGLGDLSPLPERSALARVMKELDQHIRPESSAKYSGKTVTLLRSNVDVSQLQAARGGGLRGWMRDAAGIAEQARLTPVHVPVEALDGGKRVLINVSKAGFAVAGLTISWPAVALTVGFVALDNVNQARRRQFEMRIATFIEKAERRELERRIAAQRGNEDELNRVASRLLDGTAAPSADMAVLRLRIRDEFDDSVVALERIQGILNSHRLGTIGTNSLTRDLDLKNLNSVVGDLLHARGAIDQRRRFLVMEITNEALLRVAANDSLHADYLAKQLGDTEAADDTLRKVIADLSDLQLTARYPWTRKQHKKLTDSLKAALSLAFPDVSLPDDDALGGQTLVVDSSGRVYQLAAAIDLDQLERSDLQRQMAYALRALLARRADEEEWRAGPAPEQVGSQGE